MIRLRLDNFEPANLDSLEETYDWDFKYEKGKYFSAISKSRDKRVICTYTLSKDKESILVESIDRYDFKPNNILVKKSKPLNNDGNGYVFLSGGYVSRRFGYFRKKDFQEFLEKHCIDSVRNFNDYGFCTTYVVESNDLKRNRIILPEVAPVSIISRNRAYRFKESKRNVISDDSIVVKITDAQFWIYDESTPSSTTRKLFVHGSRVNALDFDKELSEMLEGVQPL